MAGIMNNTARQFNLKVMGAKRHRVVVRIAPGFNVVDDEHWNHFIKPKVNPYVAELKKKGLIDFGDKMDDLELERDPDTKSKSKSSPPPSPSKFKNDDDLDDDEDFKKSKKSKKSKRSKN